MGINGTNKAVDAIKAGKLMATGDYNAVEQGCIGVTIAVRSLRQEPVPTNVVPPAMLIDKSSLADDDTPAADRTCPALAHVPKR